MRELECQSLCFNGSPGFPPKKQGSGLPHCQMGALRILEAQRMCRLLEGLLDHVSVIILPSKSSTWRLSAFLMSHIFKDHFCPSGYFWFQPATRMDTWPYNYYKTAGQRFTAASLIISYLHCAPWNWAVRWKRLWGIALKLTSDPVLHCVFEATVVQCSCKRTLFPFLSNSVHFP